MYNSIVDSFVTVIETKEFNLTELKQYQGTKTVH